METRKLHRDDVVTGVLQNNRCEWIHEDAIGNGIDLRYEDAVAEYLLENPEDENLEDFEYDCDGGTYLIGFKKNDETGLYEEDPDAEYSAIVDYDGHYTTQVTASKYAVECNRCSPCYPNQGNIDDAHNGCYIAFCPPPDAYGENDEMDKNRIFKIEFVDEK